MHQEVYAMALKAERQLLPARVEQGWRAAQAKVAAGAPCEGGVNRVRLGVGTFLLRVGTRLQAAPAGSGFESPAPAQG